MKETIKNFLLAKLHAVRKNDFDIANAIATSGVRGLCGLDFNILKSEVLTYVQSMRIEGVSYKYAASCKGECLYNSIYAVMINGLLGMLPDESTCNEWGTYLNTFQSDKDGLYYDSRLAGDAFEHIGIWNEGWGKHHLLGHIIIALARLNVLPKYPFKFMEWAYDKDVLIDWMSRFDFAGDVWTASNYFMNLFVALEYERDYMNESRAIGSVETIIEWLLKKQNSVTGMWHDRAWKTLDHFGKLKVVRAAYHFYPLFEYEKIEVPHAGEIVDAILPLQNGLGGWTVEGGNSGACEDIDAIEPLIRFADSRPEKRREIEAAVKRSMVWQLACRNPDGGFSFYCQAGQEYGGHPLTTSLRGESSMFATWFRLLCLAYEMRFLGMENGFDIGRYPGYEIT